MKASTSCRSAKGLVVLSQFLILISIASLAGGAHAATTLISDSVSTRAVAFESGTMKPEPFVLTPTVDFGTDNRTRVVIFAMNLDLLAGEGVSALTSDAEDAAHNHYSMTVEYVGQV